MNLFSQMPHPVIRGRLPGRTEKAFTTVANIHQLDQLSHGFSDNCGHHSLP
jgi:hypothetical protein